MNLLFFFFFFFKAVFYRKVYKGKRITLKNMEDSLDSTIQSLPVKGKRLFLKSYEALSKEGVSEDKAKEYAFDIVSSSFKQRGDSWSTKQDVVLETAIIKEGGFFNPQFNFSATISSTAMDDQKQYVDKTLLQQLSSKGLIDNYGDIFHFGAKGDSSWKGLFKKTDASMNDDKLDIKFNLDTKHKKFKDFIKLSKKYDFSELSAEFYNPVMMGNRIIRASGLGWTLTNKGSNPDAKVHN